MGASKVVFITVKFCVNVAKCLFLVLLKKNVQSSKFCNSNEKNKNPDVIEDKHIHWRDVDRWTWWSVNQSKPSAVDSLSSFDWVSRELFGR